MGTAPRFVALLVTVALLAAVGVDAFAKANHGGFSYDSYEYMFNNVGTNSFVVEDFDGDGIKDVVSIELSVSLVYD